MRLGAAGSREIHIESIKFIDKHKGQDGEDIMRYWAKARTVERVKGGTDKAVQKLIQVEFRYADLDLTAEDRYSNPLGFQVTSYRVDDDSITQ
jgi:type IV secretory pathway component VirB8